MENGLGCHSLKMPALSQATSNGSSTNGNTTTSSELFCQINDPEDVGAIVTSFCKVIQDGYGQIKKEIVTENEAVLGISTAKPLHDPTSIIKDEPNGSEDTQIQFNENVEDDDDDQEENFEKNSIKYEEEEIKENNHEEKLEPKDIIVSIKDANEDSSSRSSSSEAEDVKDEPAQNIDAILAKPELKRQESDDIVEEEEDSEEEIDDDEPEDILDDKDSDDVDEDEDGDEPSINKATLRVRARNEIKDKARAQREINRQISRIIKKTQNDDELTIEEEALLQKNPKVFDEISRRNKRRKTTELRKQEIEDSPTVLAKKCDRMAKAIQKAKYLIVYTGAGISTAANIPDYRGPNGVWTCMDEGREIQQCDLAQAEPTYTHMALFTLFKKGKMKHIVSQNCDGLHLRSGIPRYALSEVHGNMFIEVCKHCKPMRPYLRLFDVTERTSKNKHNTMRRCHVCGKSLIDTIVHFGERGSIKWPINWDGASKAAEKADVIICFGSSLKVLRRYPWLWCMDRPKKHRPKLYIVNLQWTPKDSAATCKLNGRCDDVMRRVMSNLEIEVPNYYAENDPLLTYSTPLHSMEEHTTTREELIGKQDDGDGGRRPSADSSASNGSNESDVKSWALDHAYVPNEIGSKPKPNKGKLVKSKKLDYRNIMWPRDALYISYKDDKFEYINDLEAQDEPTYYCDCCDPARQKKRAYSDDSSEEESDEDEDEDEDLEDEDKASTTSSSETKTDQTNNSASTSNNGGEAKTLQPGWFGKGRRKRARC